MKEQKFQAADKKVSRMSRDGLVEENLATGKRENVSRREKEVELRKQDDSQSLAREGVGVYKAVRKKHRQRERPQHGKEQETDKTERGYRQKNPDHNDSGERKEYYKKQYYRENSDKKEDKLHFTEDGKKAEKGNGDESRAEKSTEDFTSADKPKEARGLEWHENKAEKSAYRLEREKKKQPTKRSLRVQRYYNEEKEKAGYRLYFEETPKQPGKGGIVKHTARRAASSVGSYTHGKVYQVEKENSGVEAAHRTEQAGESTLRFAHDRPYRKQVKRQRKLGRLEHKAYRTNTRYQYKKYLSENPKMKKKLLNRFYQKQRIKREYKKAYKSGKTGKAAAGKSAGLTTKMAKRLREAVMKNKAVLLGVVSAGLLLVFMMSFFSSCSMLFTNTLSTAFFSCWLSEPLEIDKADLALTELEMELQEEIDRMESGYPGFDEYHYNLAAIEHDPFELISYLSAKYGEFTYGQVEAEILSLFHEMYTLTVNEAVETRTETEMQVLVDPITGEETAGEATVEKEYHILEITLVSKPISALAALKLDTEQMESYALYKESKGGLQQFGSPLELHWYHYISSYYGYRKNPTDGQRQLHRGMDIAVPNGTAVFAGHTGTVTVAAYDSGYGNYVVIEDGKGFTTKYAYLSSFTVSSGQAVDIGDKIGETGSTGSSVGSSLHLELLYEGEYYNPLFYFAVGEGTIYGEPSGGGSGGAVPPGSYDDTTVETLIREAEKYLGMPYTFGGTPPASFDCSAFVCWVFTNSGVHDLPRTTAQGIYDQCTPVSAEEAKAGDIIFFTGTYNAGRPVTHVGIYCGDGIMIHCGNPIQYTSIHTPYWQSHFYGFGRLD